MCSRGLTGPPAVTLIKQLKYKKRLLLRCIHHFKSDLINNMDHMRISGNEPSSVILSQRKWFQKLKMMVWKCQRGWCNKPTILHFQSVLIRNSLMLSKRFKNWRKLTTLKLDIKYIKKSHMQNFSSICQSMLEKSAENWRKDGRTSPYHNTSRLKTGVYKWQKE